MTWIVAVEQPGAKTLAEVTVDTGVNGAEKVTVPLGLTVEERLAPGRYVGMVLVALVTALALTSAAGRRGDVGPSHVIICHHRGRC